MIRVRVRYDSRIAKALIGAGSITLYPFIFIWCARADVPPQMLEHEFVHVRQVRRLGWLRFYASYLWEYLGHLVRLRSHWAAYAEISFEREAYAKQATVALTAAERAEIA